MDIFNSRYYRISTLFLSCVGLYPYQNHLSKIWFRFLCFSSLTFKFIPQVFYLHAVWNDVNNVLDTLPSFFFVLTGYGQIFVYLFNKQKLKRLFEFIESDWKIWSSGAEYKILRSFAEDGRTFMVLFAGYIYTTTGVFIIMSMTPIVLDILIPLNESRPKQMVYPALFPFSHEKYFYWILIYGCVTAIYNVTIIISCEGMFAVMAQHACGLFAIISYRLRNAMQFMEGKNLKGKKDLEDGLYNNMSFTIERHSYAIEFANMIEACYSPSLLFTVGFNMIAASAVGIQTLISLGEVDKTIKFGSFACGLVLHLYCISLPAQKLKDYSTNVARNVSNECWYQMPIKSRKLLTMIIMRGHVPCRLTAGKFYTMDMITFSTMLKTVISYFTVLSSMR